MQGAEKMDYSKLYDECYYRTQCGSISYLESEKWQPFYEKIAEKIVKDFNPSTVLDVGCAIGYLVAALRDRGVEAYGIDISEFAISKVRDDIRPYCIVWSALDLLPETLPQKYDLLITIEVAEHLYEEDTPKFIENICRYSDKIIFSSTPDDIYEKTHFNVKQAEYWAKRFAFHNFYKDFNYNMSYITPHASLFVKQTYSLDKLVENYEYYIKILKNQIMQMKNVEHYNQQILTELSENNMKLKNIMVEKDILTAKITETEKLLDEVQNNLNKKSAELEHNKVKIEELRNEIENYKTLYINAANQRDDLNCQLIRVNDLYHQIYNSTCWKITKPLRVLLDFIKKTSKLSNITHNFYKLLKSLRQFGVKYTLKKIKRKLIKRDKKQGFFKLCHLSDEEREKQKKAIFKRDIKFSIIVPLYNTPDRFFKDMVESVISQTYSNWELCMADGSDKDNNIEVLCKKYQKSYKNIKYKKLNVNFGISGNTIEAYKLASGDYFILLDHDDILTEDALYELAVCINNYPEADFIYSDRGIFSDKTNQILAYHYLPAYSPDFLRSCNYASHLNAFSRYIIDEVGFLRTGFDGSQDYDLELRVIEKARKIINIPKVLYYCRACEGSVALNPESKTYAYEAGRRAIEEHINRIGYPGKVEFLQETFTYRIHYDIKKKEKVSIIIPNKDNTDVLKRCVDSILEKTDYDNYQKLLLWKISIENRTFEYYKNLNNNPRILVLYYDNKEFNYSAINNFAVSKIDTPYILFLNNDVDVINSNWLTEMIMLAQRSDVGAVGAKLYYPNDTFQHIGLFIGLGGHIASHYDHKKNRFETGYMNRLVMVQNYNAVTAACLLMKKEDFIKVEGFDEVNFKVGLNDIDLCLKLREIGKFNVLTPYAELYHYESLTRGSDEKGESRKRFEKECKMFRAKWKKYFESIDEYTNPNFECEVVQL